MEDNQNLEPGNAGPVPEVEKDMEEETGKSKKEIRKEKKRAKKAAKKAAKKEAYQALSPKKKAVYWGKRFLAVLLTAALFFGIGRALYMPALLLFGERYLQYLQEQEVSEEDLLAMAPVDQRLSEKVDAVEAYGEDDTWAVYVYLCGSNLEGNTMNNLSDFSKILLKTQRDAIEERDRNKKLSMLTDYIEELGSQGMDVPDYMYLNTPMAPKEPEGEPEEAPSVAGGASMDLEEMWDAGLSDQVKIVVQTGGSAAWKFAGANPNRSQRFVVDQDGIRLLEDNHFANMGESETLADFFRFCEKAAPADHRIAVFWDHGAGPFGFASDDLYGGDTLTLKEMGQALEEVYGGDPANPPFEILGFDACLMASVEVAEALHGYGCYLAASEEIEPGHGWDYTPWLNALSEDPAMNGAQVGRAITDSFIEYYAKKNVRLEPINLQDEVTFSVLDLEEAHKVYQDYCELADTVLQDAIRDMDTLVTLGRAADQTVRFGGPVYSVFNTIDLANLAENLKGAYPDEAGALLDSIDRAVIYNRTTRSISGSRGISVYFPAEIPDATSLVYCLDYIRNICADDSIRALYYYKISGCLSEEMQAYADGAGYGRAQKLDNTPLRNLQYEELAMDSDRFSLTLPENSESLIQAGTFYLAGLDGEDIVNYGEDGFVKTEDGKLVSTFDGKWLTMDGNLLPLEQVGTSAAGTGRYRTKVQHKGTDSYMMLTVDEASGNVQILGIYDAVDPNGEASATRNIKNVQVGDELRIIYDQDSFEVGGHTERYGPKFTYKASTDIGYETVKDGVYLATLVMYDMRGDAFYSPIVQYEIKGGKTVSMKHRDDVVVSTYE